MSTQIPVIAVFLISPITAVGLSILACAPDPDPIDLSVDVPTQIFVAPESSPPESSPVESPTPDLRIATVPGP